MRYKAHPSAWTCVLISIICQRDKSSLSGAAGKKATSTAMTFRQSMPLLREALEGFGTSLAERAMCLRRCVTPHCLQPCFDLSASMRGPAGRQADQERQEIQANSCFPACSRTCIMLVLWADRAYQNLHFRLASVRRRRRRRRLSLFQKGMKRPCRLGVSGIR
jgi:hypothetical protein